jgi:uncharacterized linocin/CFP29 family protein
MNHLLRELAPITGSGWQMLDDEATQRLTPALAARKLVDFSGPHGWQHSATNLGRTEAIDSSSAHKVSALARRVLPIVELRVDFQLSRAELRDADRGADDADLGPLDQAANEIAAAENQAVFHGWADVLHGISEASPHGSVALATDADRYPQVIAGAVEQLLGSGVEGPYGLAVDSEQFRLISQTTEHGGYPLLEHLRGILGGPIVWTPGVSGAFVVSQRGGDFVVDSGQDLSIGYDWHDAETVGLYLQESFSFHVATPEAAVVLTAES